LISPELLIISIVIIGAVVYRFRKISSGGKVNRNKIIGLTIFYIAISFLTVFSSFQIGISVQYLPVYIGLLTGSTYLSYRSVGKRLTFWKTDEGFTHVKGGTLPYVVWLVGLVARFVLEYLFIGPDFLTAVATQKSLSTTTVEITLLVDMILMIGVGALTGRNLQILTRLKNFEVNQKST
ncbi:MAG TPA: hypothetical protein VET47_00140, partial [Candidatus Limnocylindrales bacterium]|nr:hypothetical protein [Candidatus Limnocylindrales bacterium]